jgi:prepilin-type N-terminal cleavage/methylation domain-containing protein
MKREKGVTLLEILVVLGIMAMISLALWRLLSGGLDIWRAGKEKTDVVQQARVAMNRLTREVRETTEISDATSTGIEFKAYLGTTAEKSITYYYRSADKALYRKNITDATGERVMAQNIDDFTLAYYSKKTGTIYDFTPGTGTYSHIYMISVDSFLKRGAAPDEATVSLRSTVQPRNYSYPLQ